ncbi:MAG: DUF86 domain-containing protein [Alphaproteobacteria bacterium]|nr:DUF86 domain-containing protein [Alphaproteobacteria bacterium]
MLAHAEEAIELLAGRTNEDFASDRLHFLAACRLVEIIGEAAAQVPDDVRTALAAIPFRAAALTRNRLIHGYGAVDPIILADTIRLDLPPLADASRNELAAPLPDEAPPP